LTAGLDVAGLLRGALRTPAPEPAGPPLLDRAGIEALLPHRGLALLLDAVLHLEADPPTIVAEYDLAGASAVLAGHFPGRPVWPGLLQAEAIGQAGLLAARARAGARGEGALTDVLAARFVRPIEPPGRVRIAARVLADGLFEVVVGQCTFAGRVCSAAVLRGLAAEAPAEGGS
jgi:3-hydroxyacyl-[acyl-carrier-protein] dehydratase